MRISHKATLLCLISLLMLLMALVPITSAGGSTTFTGVQYSCDRPLFINWQTTSATGGNISIVWNGGSASIVPVVGFQSYSINQVGPITFTMTSSGSSFTGGPITCTPGPEPTPEPEPEIVEPTGHCFEDGRVNRNCGATVSVYLSEVEEGWNMLLIGWQEDLGGAQGDKRIKHIFVSYETLNAMEPGDVLVFGIVTIEMLADGSFLLVAPREDGLPYYLHFELAGPGDAFISDGDLG